MPIATIQADVPGYVIPEGETDAVDLMMHLSIYIASHGRDIPNNKLAYIIQDLNSGIIPG